MLAISGLRTKRSPHFLFAEYRFRIAAVHGDLGTACSAVKLHA